MSIDARRSIDEGGWHMKTTWEFSVAMVLVAYQAHHLDPEFSDRHYQSDVLTDSHRTHQAVWHQE
jgi:hypothetical protein